VLVPLGTYLNGWHQPNDSMAIFAQARSAEEMQAAEDEARLLVRACTTFPTTQKMTSPFSAPIPLWNFGKA